MDEQIRKLIDTLTLTIGLLRYHPALTDSLAALGRRHVIYGVKAEQYRPVGEALLWTLHQALGDDFTPETRGAWLALYEAASRIMLDAEAGPLAFEEMRV